MHFSYFFIKKTTFVIEFNQNLVDAYTDQFMT